MEQDMTFVSERLPQGKLNMAFTECGHVVRLEERHISGRPVGKCDECWVCLTCGVSLVGMRKTRAAAYCIRCCLQNEIAGRRRSYRPLTAAEKARKKSNRQNKSHRKRSMNRHTDITTRWLYKFRMRAKVCALCNIDLENVQRHVDHIIPLGAGGTHTRDNVRVLCSDCNLKRPKDGSDVHGHQMNIFMEVA
jgi:5-methylcytosine-specific restriction endonuclease McrA